ncbi:MAG: hypothetical protein C5B53_06470 [Candidatus Melainabacteria bacterium]|nr:MAG: hypothetical protein C5B53_06470 [Candidatus Melainabacteria bacterium]
MKKKNIHLVACCPHSELAVPEGLVLIAIEDSQKSFLGNLCNTPSQPSLENICKFKIRADAEDLATYLKGHKAAIIIDSASDGSAPGTISLMDLGAMLEKSTPLKIGSRHGFYLARQLRELKKSGQLPERMIFFGVENSEVQRSGNGTGSQPNTAQSPKTLILMINKAAQALNRHA